MKYVFDDGFFSVGEKMEVLSLPYRIIKIALEPNDNETRRLIENANKRREQIAFNSADSFGKNRSPDEVKYKSLIGLIAEQLCFDMLKKIKKDTQNNVDVVLNETLCSCDQIDLYVQKRWDNCNNIQKTIEVRSSSFFTSITQAIQKNFDVIGPYRNNVKSNMENHKDYYLRFLYHIEASKDELVKTNDKIDYSRSTLEILKRKYFNEKLQLKHNLCFYFVGGATKEMMQDESIAYSGNMNTYGTNTVFQTIKMRNALDSVAMLQLIFGCKN